MSFNPKTLWPERWARPKNVPGDPAARGVSVATTLGRLLLHLILPTILTLASAHLNAAMTPAWVIESSDFQATIVSTNPAEKDSLLKDGWKIDATGAMQTDWATGAGALHRLSRKTEKGIERTLETDVRQLPVLTKMGFTDEGVVGFVADSDGPERMPVIQFSKGDRKLWVVSKESQAKLEQAGWTRQGIHFWLWPSVAK